VENDRKRKQHLAFAPVLVLIVALIAGVLLTGCDVDELLGTDDDDDNGTLPEYVGEIAHFLLAQVPGGALGQYNKAEGERDFPDGVVAEYDLVETGTPQKLKITVTMTDFRPDEENPDISVSGSVVVEVTGSRLNEEPIQLGAIFSVGTITAQNHPDIQTAAIDGGIAWKSEVGVDGDGPEQEPDIAEGTITVDGKVYQLKDLL
jgi:hypothetical protein